MPVVSSPAMSATSPTAATPTATGHVIIVGATALLAGTMYAFIHNGVAAPQPVSGVLLGAVLGKWRAPRFCGIGRVDGDSVTPAEARALTAWFSATRIEFSVVIVWPLLVGAATIAHTMDPLLAVAAAVAGLLTGPIILCLQAGVSQMGTRATTPALRRMAIRRRLRRMLVLTGVLLAALRAENPEPWAPTLSHRRPHIAAVAQHLVAQAPTRTPIAAQAPPAAVVPDLAPPGVAAV